MLLGLTKKVLGYPSKKKITQKVLPSGTPKLIDIYGREIESGNAFIYPKQIKGIPVFSVESIYQTNKELINEIISRSGIGSHRRTEEGVTYHVELFRNVIGRFIEYAHMLPASESHHHWMTGGLIAHSLQTSIVSQRYGKEKRPESTKYLDLDVRVKPVYQYAAWLGGLLHDIGKISRDMVIDAVEIYDGNQNKRLSASHNVPQWHPQKESLVAWAKRYDVATYSVTYLKSRIHNQHNIDSVYFLAPVVGKGFALDYLVDQPVNVYEKIGEALSGHETGRDYLNSCIRHADRLNTAKGVNQIIDVHLGNRAMSKESMILKTMELIRNEWTFNRPNAHFWVLGDTVYLRYTKAFDAITKRSKELSYDLPNDTRIIISIMEMSMIVEPYDEDHKTVNFSPGEYTQADIQKIFRGDLTPPIEHLYKMVRKSTLFSHDPLPDSGVGLLLSPDGEVIDQIVTGGRVIRHEKQQAIQQVQPIASQPPAQESMPPPVETDPNYYATQEQDIAQAPEPPTVKKGKAPSTKSGTKNTEKPSVKEVVPATKSKAKQSMSDTKGIVFKNTPTKETEQQTDSEDRVNTHPDTGTEPKSDTNNALSSARSPTHTNTKDAGQIKTEAESQGDSVSKTDTAEDTTSVTDNTRLYEMAPRVEGVRQKGYFIKIDDAMTFFGTDSKPDALAMLKSAGVLALSREGRPSLDIIREQSATHTLIKIKAPQKAKKLKPDNHTNPKTEADSKEPVKNKSDVKAAPQKGKAKIPSKVKQQSQTDKKDTTSETDHDAPEVDSIKQVYLNHDSTDVTDYGLISVLMNPTPHSLASTVQYDIDARSMSVFKQINKGVLFKISEITSLLTEQYGKKVVARSLVKLLDQHEEIQKEKVERGTVYLVPYPLLNLVSLKEFTNA